MQFGLIGEHLVHSFSKEIHNMLGNYDYELKEVNPAEFAQFISKHEFEGINITIPYKEKVIPYLNELDETAKAIGAVNTVVNKGGKLFGYNTDFFGMCALVKHAGISVQGKKVAILGTGGTCKTSQAVAESLGAAEVLKVSRQVKDGAISYFNLYNEHADCQVVINTTPVGMYPKINCKPLDISKFSELSGVIDVIYNPLKTELIQDAKKFGIPSEGGLYMLVAQAVRASEIFLDCEYGTDKLNKIYSDLLRVKMQENL